MDPFKIFCRISAAIVFTLVLQACDPGVQKTTTATTNIINDTSQVSRLIKKGMSMQSNSIDSLMPIRDELFYIGTATNNNKAILYSEMFYAHYCWMKAKHTLAMQTSIKALADAEKWHINEALPDIYGTIGNLHKESKNYDLAFQAIDKAITIAKQNRDTAQIISGLGDKAMFTHGYYSFKNKRADDVTSLGLQLAALKMAESSPKYEGMRIRFYNNIGQTYKERKDYTTAIAYVDKAVALAKKYNRPRSLTYSYNWLGEAYYYMGQQAKGLDYLNKAIAITRQIDQPYRRMELNESLQDCYASSGNFKEALSQYKIYSRLKDSLEVLKNSKQLKELHLQYEGAKKDRKIAFLNESNVLNRRNVWVLGIVALLFLGLFVLVLLQYIIIRKNNKLIADKNNGLNQALIKIAFIQSHEIRKPLSTMLAILNLIKEEQYQADKDLLQMMEKSALDLDVKICEVIREVERT